MIKVRFTQSAVLMVMGCHVWGSQVGAAVSSLHPQSWVNAEFDGVCLPPTCHSDTQIKDQVTPLQSAVLRDDMAQLIKQLTNPSIDPHQRSKNGFHLLHFAAQNASPITLQAILKHLPMSVNVVCSHQQSPLYLAVANGKSENAKLLLAYGANPLLQSHTHENAIDIAITTGQPELATYLMSFPFSNAPSSPVTQHNPGIPTPRAYKGNALQHAVFQNDADVVKRLLSYGAKPHLGAPHTMSPYDMALTHPNPIIRQHFKFTDHFGPSDQTMGYLSRGFLQSRHFITFYNDLSTRLKKGANPNDLLTVSIENGLDEIASLLVAYGATPTSEQLSLLTQGAMPNTIFSLLSAGKLTIKKIPGFLSRATDEMCRALESVFDGDAFVAPFMEAPRFDPPLNLIHHLILKNDLSTLRVVLADSRFTAVSEDVKGYTPLEVAIMTLNADAVALLLASRTNHDLTKALTMSETIKQQGVKNEIHRKKLSRIEGLLIDHASMVAPSATGFGAPASDASPSGPPNPLGAITG